MCTETCADPESFVIGGPTLTTFFFVVLFFLDEGVEDPNTFFWRATSARQRNATEMAVRWCADDAPTWMLAWKLCDFSGDLDQ